jgi:hypothetical protein
MMVPAPPARNATKHNTARRAELTRPRLVITPSLRHLCNVTGAFRGELDLYDAIPRVAAILTIH